MGQNASSPPPSQISEQELLALFLQTCLSSFSAIEKHLIQSSLGSLLETTEAAEIAKLFSIPPETPAARLWPRFIHTLGRFPVLGPVTESPFLPTTDVVRAAAILTNRRTRVLGPHYSLPGLVLVALAAAGGLLKTERQTPPGRPSLTSRSYDEKTGEVTTLYPLEGNVVVWSSMPVVLRFCDVEADKVMSSDLLNLLALLLFGGNESRFNDYKKVSFDMIRSLRPSDPAALLLEKDAVFDAQEVARLFRMVPRIFDGFNKLFDTFLGVHRERLLEESKLMTLPILTELETFCPFSLGNCRNLYTGLKHGFSIKLLEYRVLNWRAPTILLVQGTIGGTGMKFNKFERKIPKTGTPLNDKIIEGSKVLFGVAINAPWRKSAKTLFGDDQTCIFQIKPYLNVFPAKKMGIANCYLNNSGVGFGSDIPNGEKLTPGNVSLIIDGNLEFAVFRHLLKKGGLFHHGKAFEEPPLFETLFSVKEIEVWGVGSDEVFKEQEESWAWEEKEAERRNRVNLKSLGEERAFLEMAGLVGQGGLGGSV